MEFTSAVGISIPKKEAKDKVTGAAKYNSDINYPGMLYGKVLTSTYAHAKIKSIDTSEALKAKGVKAVLTGDFYPVRVGTLIEDRPPIAKEKVRYFGEPVAVVVANSEHEAKNALKLVKVEYDPLKVINSVSESFKDNSTLIHENLGEYKLTNKEVKPQPYTNIVDYIHIRKGDMLKGWKKSEVIIEGVYSMPQSDHVAMETRNAIAQILPSGQVIINTSSQSPFHVKKAISKYFEIPEGDVTVVVPLVGGGFGGKSPVQLEMLAYIASRAVNGRPVRISNSREDDIEMSPSKVGLEAKVKIGAAKDGTIKALECTYLIDCGAYADICPRITTSTAMNCSGPYNIESVFCDAYCVYTNHNYGTAYRSFGHVSYAFCLERTLDKLAGVLKMNPYELRVKNAILPGNSSPTQVAMTSSNMGDITSCLKKLNEIIDCKEMVGAGKDGRMIRAKGISCFWKTSNSPSNAVSGAILTLNHDGSINLNCGAVEIGPGMKTTLAQIIAERMKMDIKRIHVFMEVDTRVCPEHWKTVASMTTFMAGRAVLKAAEDLITQLKNHATIILRCPPEDLEVSNERVYLKDNPLYNVEFKDLARGYKYPDGVTVGGQIIARGDYCVRHISKLDKETGKGKPGPSWTVGAQAVEIEYDPEEYTYRILKAITVIDAGKIINPNSAKGLIMGGMSMGLGLGSREEFIYDNNAVLKNSSLRTYKVMHFGENPEYIVDFIETPQADAPFGARGLGEHGLIGMPSALANALSAAAEAEFDRVPITGEEIWRTKTGGKL